MKLFDLDKLIDTLTGYIENRVELLKLDVREQIALVVAKVSVILLQVLLGIMVLAFIFVGIALLLNQLLNSAFLGFLIVAALFAIALWLVYAAREKLRSRVLDAMRDDDSGVKASENEA